MAMTFNTRCLWAGVLGMVVAFFAVKGIQAVQDTVRERRVDAKIAALAPLAGVGEKDSFHEQVDKITGFVWSNSLHRIDADFRKIQNRTDLQADLLRGYATGEIAEKPHLECSTRSGVVERMLWNRGYKTRSVATWRQDERLSSHTFLEVWNDAESHWEITDPDHNFYWFDTIKKRRAGIEDLMRFPVARFQICNEAEGCPSASLMRDQKLIDKMAALFGVAVIRDHAAGTRTLYHNQSRFDLSRFCERFDKYCRDRRVSVMP